MEETDLCTNYSLVVENSFSLRVEKCSSTSGRCVVCNLETVVTEESTRGVPTLLDVSIYPWNCDRRIGL